MAFQNKRTEHQGDGPYDGSRSPTARCASASTPSVPPEFREAAAELGLKEVDGVLRCRDAGLGARLGMARPTNIRQLIEANRAELETYGSLHVARAVIEAGKGATREVDEYWPNEEQALCLCTLSKAPKAPDARRMLIQVFMAWRRGQLVPAQQQPLDLTNPDHLLPLLAQYAADKKALTAQVQEMRPAVAALDRLAKSTEGAMCVTDAAKDLQTKPSDLIRFLEQNGWVYRRAGSKRRMVAYQDRIQAGHLEHKLTEVEGRDGEPKIAEQVMVTPKGRALLAKHLSARATSP